MVVESGARHHAHLSGQAGGAAAARQPHLGARPAASSCGSSDRRSTSRRSRCCGIGFIIGFIGAIMGIGGGFLLVPMLIYFLRVPTSDRDRHIDGADAGDDGVGDGDACRDQSSGRCGAGADPDGRRRDRRAVRRARRAAAWRRNGCGCCSACWCSASACVSRSTCCRSRPNCISIRFTGEADDDARSPFACVAADAACGRTGVAPSGWSRRCRSHQVLMTSSFTGIELVLFGSVERDANDRCRAGATTTSSSP